MSATEEDTELRDLLIQNLENSGVLNKIKAELRAAVFVALEEQEKQEKPALENECLKKCLNTKDGRLAASLVSDFLHVFNLDFTLAVFQPEVNSSVDGRESVCRDLGVHDGDVNKSSPLLLEVVRRSRHRDKSHPTATEGERASQVAKELSPRQIAEARRKFDAHSKDKTGVKTEMLAAVFVDLYPAFSRSMLECYVKDELDARDKDASSVVDFQEFLGMLKRFFMQCRSVVISDAGETPSSAVRGIEERVSSHPLSRALSDLGDGPSSPGQSLEDRISSQPPSRIPRLKGQSAVSLEESDRQIPEVKGQMGGSGAGDGGGSGGGSLRKTMLAVEDEDEDEGDSFFDDPLPKPQKTYGSRLSSVDRSASDRSISLKDKHQSGSEGRTASQKNEDRNDEDVNYDDDFNSHRTENSRSEISIGEEIEEGSLDGPDFSDKVESTLDISVSQLSEGADYLEEVS